MLQQETLSSDEIQALGEELGNLQGKTVESKIGLQKIIKRLEALS